VPTAVSSSKNIAPPPKKVTRGGGVLSTALNAVRACVRSDALSKTHRLELLDIVHELEDIILEREREIEREAVAAAITEYDGA